MKVNVDETKIIILAKGRMPVNLQFKNSWKDIEIVKDFNYLGIYFLDLVHSKHIKNTRPSKLLRLCTKF